MDNELNNTKKVNQVKLTNITINKPKMPHQKLREPNRARNNKKDKKTTKTKLNEYLNQLASL